MKIKILGVDIEVRVCPQGEVGDGDWQGRANYQESLIKISGLLDKESQRKTFLHEILHFLNHEMSIKIEENNINRLETGLYAVMQDNPHIFDYKWKGDK